MFLPLDVIGEEIHGFLSRKEALVDISKVEEIYRATNAGGVNRVGQSRQHSMDSIEALARRWSTERLANTTLCRF